MTFEKGRQFLDQLFGQLRGKGHPDHALATFTIGPELQPLGAEWRLTKVDDYKSHGNFGLFMKFQHISQPLVIEIGFSDREMGRTSALMDMVGMRCHEALKASKRVLPVVG